MTRERLYILVLLLLVPSTWGLLHGDIAGVLAAPLTVCAIYVALVTASFYQGSRRGLDELCNAAAAHFEELFLPWRLDECTRCGAYRTKQYLHR